MHSDRLHLVKGASAVFSPFTRHLRSRAATSWRSDEILEEDEMEGRMEKDEEWRSHWKS